MGNLIKRIQRQHLHRWTHCGRHMLFKQDLHGEWFAFCDVCGKVKFPRSEEELPMDVRRYMK